MRGPWRRRNWVEVFWLTGDISPMPVNGPHPQKLSRGAKLNPPPQQDPGTRGEQHEDIDAAISPDLFTQPERQSYASAAAAGTQDSLHKQETEEETRKWCAQLEREEEAIAVLKASTGHKCDLPTPSQSDDEQGGPHKKSMTPATPTVNESE